MGLGSDRIAIMPQLAYLLLSLMRQHASKVSDDVKSIWAQINHESTGLLPPHAQLRSARLLLRVLCVLAQVTQEEYNTFFTTTFREFLEPLAQTHFNVEGTIEFSALLFVPSMAPFEQQVCLHCHLPCNFSCFAMLVPAAWTLGCWPPMSNTSFPAAMGDAVPHIGTCILRST